MENRKLQPTYTKTFDTHVHARLFDTIQYINRAQGNKNNSDDGQSWLVIMVHFDSDWMVNNDY